MSPPRIRLPAPTIGPAARSVDRPIALTVETRSELEAAVSLVLIAVALLASYLPARRASRIDPLIALRDE